MTGRQKERTGSRLVALLGALALVAVMGGGCSGELPLELEATYSNDDCYWINGTWHCPHQ